MSGSESAAPSLIGERTKFVELCERTAVYDRSSGQTHILDPFSATVLQALQRGVAGGDEHSVASSVAADLGVEHGASAADLTAALERLRSAGLA
jgi:PqqD family protein of HPr-rel-A system